MGRSGAKGSGSEAGLGEKGNLPQSAVGETLPSNPPSKKKWKRSHTSTIRERRRYYWSVRKLQQDLRNLPCKDCKGIFPWYAMDFDHRDQETKICLVTKARSKKRVLEEAAKCDVVCSNCHRIRTYLRWQQALEEVDKGWENKKGYGSLKKRKYYD